ncbi:unnamed protein product, partial [marine sediment metagenome]
MKTEEARRRAAVLVTLWLAPYYSDDKEHGGFAFSIEDDEG